MYYEEKVINGILCFKSSPNGAWIEYSLESLTKMYEGLKSKYINQDDIFRADLKSEFKRIIDNI